MTFEAWLNANRFFLSGKIGGRAKEPATIAILKAAWDGGRTTGYTEGKDDERLRYAERANAERES